MATNISTVLVSDLFFRCISSLALSVNVSPPVLTAAVLQTELRTGRGQAFAPITLHVIADNSVAGQ